MKLLIGYDGSECADAALDDLRRAGLPDNIEARILSVAEVFLPPVSPSGSEGAPISEAIYAKARQAMVHAEALAERARGRLQELFPGWQVKAEAAAGSPAWELVFRADSWKPDLVIVGSYGRTALGRFVLGSVSQSVLTEARTSVRIARGKANVSETPVKIIVGVDGSQGSKLALSEVAKRSWPETTEVRVMMVSDPLVPKLVTDLLSPIVETVEEVSKADQRWAEQFLAECEQTLMPTGLKITTEIREGDPKRELPELAESWKADCIFVGSQGFSNRLERFVLGSVSSAVAARAQCSVEVVRG
jgi:nucleotide-binding universal stress UspA family protein